MSWKDKLQPASFRGVAFHVEGDDRSGGRRLQVHEYPQREEPYAEDIGRAAREINLTAFVIGAEYMAARDRLLTALEASGPATLVHPWYGAILMAVKEYRVTHTRDEGGMCRFQITLVEAGSVSYPQVTVSTQAATCESADTLAQASVQDFSTAFSVEGQPAPVYESALESFSGALDTVAERLRFVDSQVTRVTRALNGDLGALLGKPGDLATRCFKLFQSAQTLAQRIGRLASRPAAREMSRGVTGLLSVAATFTAPTVSASTPSQQRINDNHAAVQALFRRACLVQSAGLASVMPVPVYEDALQVRASLLAALDREATVSSDAVFVALSTLRSKVYRDLTDRARDSARLITFIPPEVTGALVIAYDLHEDARREEEIVDRNRIAHPGFVPVAPLRVLSR